MHWIAHGPDHALADHLKAVAAGCAGLAPEPARAWAHLAGLWHDLGKFRPGFQAYVRADPDLLALPEGPDPRAARMALPGLADPEEPLAQGLALWMLFNRRRPRARNKGSLPAGHGATLDRRR